MEKYFAFCYCGHVMKCIDINNDYYTFKCKRCLHTEKKPVDKNLTKKTDEKNEKPKFEILSGKEIDEWEEENLKSEISDFKCEGCGSKFGKIQYSHERSFSKPTNLKIICSKCGKWKRLGNA